MIRKIRKIDGYYICPSTHASTSANLRIDEWRLGIPSKEILESHEIVRYAMNGYPVYVPKNKGK